ncbi:MAG TPA: aspartyl/asparaginyl beta-hydroxylase domain-containing protein [Hanamia sp.]|nr:aspartyl/asparaginyl beta-hydroxylase domain-containing protein [Hanamia sp.]
MAILGDINRPAFYTIDEFPRFRELCDNWQIIREEFLQINAPLMNVHRHAKKLEEFIKQMQLELENGNDYGWVRGWGKEGINDDWIQYAIYSNSSDVNKMLEPYINKLIPRTLEMLKRISGIKICGFAKLKAHSMLPCHTHEGIYKESLLQFHLPIVTAPERNYAYLNVMGEFRRHVEGEPIIFDGSLDHFAINESDFDRTVVYMEFKKELIV